MSEYFSLNDTKTTPSSFICIPKEMLSASKFSGLSCQSKLLYALLLDRVSLSLKNKLADKSQRVYVIFKQSEVMQLLGCGKNFAVKIFKELENANLIERKHQGLNRPDLIFVKKIEPECLSTETLVNTNTEPKISYVRFHKQTSGGISKQTSGGLRDKPIIKTDTTNTEQTKTSIYPTDSRTVVYAAPKQDEENHDGLMDCTTTNIPTLESVKNQICYDAIVDDENKPVLDVVVSTMRNTYASLTKTVNINNIKMPVKAVKDRLFQLGQFEIEYVIECIQKRKTNAEPIRNMFSYLLNCLYNAPDTIDLYYKQQIRHKLNTNSLNFAVNQNSVPKSYMRDLSVLEV